MTTENYTRQLEDILDRTSLQDILSALSAICADKAEHVSSNWQDEALAKAWQRAAEYLNNASGARAVQNLPA